MFEPPFGHSFKLRSFELEAASCCPGAKLWLKNDRIELRQTLLVNKEKYPFSNEINIFGNNVCIISYRDQFGVMIESLEISKTQRAVFELAWLGTLNLNNNI